MAFFTDLTPHTYTDTGKLGILNVGWLGLGEPFAQGETSDEFRQALQALCRRPVHLYRGSHTCHVCTLANGNGQVQIMSKEGVWFAAPTLIHHYVSEHRYLPPKLFIDAVLSPAAVTVK